MIERKVILDCVRCDLEPPLVFCIGEVYIDSYFVVVLSAGSNLSMRWYILPCIVTVGLNPRCITSRPMPSDANEWELFNVLPELVKKGFTVDRDSWYHLVHPCSKCHWWWHWFLSTGHRTFSPISCTKFHRPREGQSEPDNTEMYYMK